MDYLFPYREEAWPKAKEAETQLLLCREGIKSHLLLCMVVGCFREGGPGLREPLLEP